MCQCPNRASFISTCTPLEKSCPTSLRCVNALIGLLSFLPVLTNIIVALVIMCQCPNRASFISTILLYYFLNSRMCQCPNRASFISTTLRQKWKKLITSCVNALIGLLSFLQCNTTWTISESLLCQCPNRASFIST